MMAYLSLGAGAVAVVAIGTAVFLDARLDARAAEIEALQGQLDRTRAELAGCAARTRNILRDKESDREIDNLTDDDLRAVPPHWLRP